MLVFYFLFSICELKIFSMKKSEENYVRKLCIETYLEPDPDESRCILLASLDTLVILSGKSRWIQRMSSTCLYKRVVHPKDDHHAFITLLHRRRKNKANRAFLTMSCTITLNSQNIDISWLTELYSVWLCIEYKNLT